MFGHNALKRPKLALLSALFALIMLLTACGNRLPGIIIFVSDRDGFEEIYKVNPDGSNLTRVTYSKTPGRIISALLSPDAKRILYTFTGGGSGETFSEVYRIDLDGTNWTPLISGPIENARWTLDGTGILYNTTEDRYAGREKVLYWADLNGQNTRKLDSQTAESYLPLQERAVLPDRCRKEDGPIVSADGKRWACKGLDWGWIVVNSDSSNPQKLNLSGDYLKWSPDGAAIVGRQWNAIVVIEVGASEARMISKSSDNDAWRDKLPDWR